MKPPKSAGASIHACAALAACRRLGGGACHLHRAPAPTMAEPADKRQACTPTPHLSEDI
ncbi:hypothetical protein [Acidovorax sp. sic0104]|uniref:hypothetical protein n=1 Tax=Acidovorax sp. sic0104 TaxID=2854784 RepID=UPI001C45E3F3|nr:hypothetical protein [Acidovorax sp. sic0104]MBV7540032.1 hypothetical protein [Acidovorax sp. sic0104]